LTKTFKEIIAGVRTAVLGIEVREDIAQGMEHVEQFAETATTKAQEAADSAAAAKKAQSDTAEAKTEAVQAISAEKQTSLDAIGAAKSGALTDISSARTTALSDVAVATKTASSAASTATEKAEAASTSANAAKTSETNSGTNAANAKGSESKTAEYLQATKEYFEQVRTITIGAQGWYATPEALKAAVPVGENGWWAVVGTTDTIWTWDGDTNTWVNTTTKVDLSDFYTKEQADAKFGTPYTLPVATADTLGGVMVGKNITNKDGTISLTGENVVAALTYTPATKDEATQTTPGLLSAADKAKLDSLDGSGSIAASGTNYVRFTDGTQICWGKIASGSTKFSFPAAFIDTNYAFGYMSTGTYTLPNGSMSDSKVDSRYVSSCTTTGLSLVSSGGGIRLIVIGRWK